jgi:hypothetical protein
MVAAAVRAATLKLDSEPTAALHELSSLACTILDRFTERRWGALLDEAHLAGLEPVRNRETLRLVAAATLTAGAAVGIGLLNPPASATPLLVGAVGLIFFSVTYGHRGPRAMELLDSLRGVQRP